MYAVETMKNICREHVSIIHKENEVEGFTRIVQKTGIRELKNMDIQGFECHFCEAKFSDEKYIIVYQNKTHINEIIDKEDKCNCFIFRKYILSSVSLVTLNNLNWNIVRIII